MGLKDRDQKETLRSRAVTKSINTVRRLHMYWRRGLDDCQYLSQLIAAWNCSVLCQYWHSVSSCYCLGHTFPGSYEERVYQLTPGPSTQG